MTRREGQEAGGVEGKRGKQGKGRKGDTGGRTCVYISYSDSL